MSDTLRQLIRSKRAVALLVFGVVAIVSLYKAGYEQGFDEGWTYGRLEARIEMMERSYLPAEPDLGSGGENPAR